MAATGKVAKSTGIPTNKGGPEKDTPAKKEFSAKQLVLGLIFGIAFGFLLQKGGVAKYHILIGVLLLEDFTVIKVMLTAIIVGCIGIFSLYAMGLVKLHVKPTRYAANILGGLSLRRWLRPARLLPRNRRGGAGPRQLGRDRRHCRTDDRFVLVCRGLRLVRKNAHEDRRPRQADAAGSRRSSTIDVSNHLRTALDRRACGR